jgi:hypothetical protein
LNALEHHKSFLFGIFKKESPEFVEKLETDRERKLTKIRNKWLETVKYTGMLDEDGLLAPNEADAKSGTGHGKRKPDVKKNYSDEELI